MTPRSIKYIRILILLGLLIWIVVRIDLPPLEAPRADFA